MNFLRFCLLATALVVALPACDKEQEEETVPFEFQLDISSDESTATITCGAPFYKNGFAEGYASEIGVIRKAESPWAITECTALSPTQVNFIVDGVLAGRRGTLLYRGDFVSDLATMMVTGTTEITGGTGDFEGARGLSEITSGTITGAFTEPPFTIESRLIGSGYLIYRK